jgi:GMP reductase
VKLDKDTRRVIYREPEPISFYRPGVKMKFYGMSSQEAMDKHYGGKADYRASEGKVVEIPYKGPVENTVEEILGGLRSACTYVGAQTLKQLPKCCTFIKVNRILNDKFGVEQ